MVVGRELGEVLSRSHALPALLALLHRQPLGIVELTRAMGGWSGSGRILATIFEEAGLVAVVEKEGPVAGRAAYEVSLTPLGEHVAAALAHASTIYDEGRDKKGSP